MADPELDMDSLLGDLELDPDLDRLGELSRNRNSFRLCIQAFMNLPLKILQRQGDDTRQRLSDLQQRITEMDKRITSGMHDIDPFGENQILNDFSLEHLRLRRRWRFQTELGTNLLHFFDSKAPPSTLMYVRKMRERVEINIRFADSFQNDFEMIPRRIENLSKMVCIYLSALEIVCVCVRFADFFFYFCCRSSISSCCGITSSISRSHRVPIN
jgi:hypothetical protein